MGQLSQLSEDSNSPDKTQLLCCERIRKLECHLEECSHMKCFWLFSPLSQS